MSKSIQDKLEAAVDEIVHAPTVEKKTRKKKEVEPIDSGESHSVNYDENDKHIDLYPTPMSMRHKGYQIVHK